MFQKRKKVVIICLFILLVGIPFLVHCLFKIKLRNVFWIAEWSAGEFLSYYGSVLSFLATVMLSLLALWQNEVIRKESNKHTAWLEEMEQSRYCPYFKITYISERERHSNIVVNFSNVTDNIALNVRIYEIQNSFRHITNFDKSYEILNAHESIEVALGNGVMGREDLLLMEIQCSNIYGNIIFFSVEGKYNCENRFFEFKVTKLKKY